MIMGTDSKLFNKENGKRIYCDRFRNLQNDYSELFDPRGNLTTTGMRVEHIREMCDNLISLSELDTETLMEIRKELDEHYSSDVFRLIDEHHKDY